jgi:hypothetical protein
MQIAMFDVEAPAPTLPTHSAPRAARPRPSSALPAPGLDLGTGEGAPPDDAEGFWQRGTRTITAYLDEIAAVEARLEKADPRLRPYVALGVSARRATLQKMLDWIGADDREVGIWGHHEQLGLGPGRAFAALCESGAIEGAQTRVRAHRDWREWVLYVEALGTLSLWTHVDETGQETRGDETEAPYVFEYSPGRESAIAESFRDVRTVIDAPISVWGSLAASALSAVGEAPSVPSVLHEGRRYVTTGALYHGEYAEGYAWTVVAREDWSGAVCTRDELLRLWDRGVRERGDDRGLQVTVRGQRCVLGAPVLFVDRCASARRGAPVVEEADADEDTDDLDDAFEDDDTEVQAA